MLLNKFKGYRFLPSMKLNINFTKTFAKETKQFEPTWDKHSQSKKMNNLNTMHSRRILIHQFKKIPEFFNK